MIPQESRIFGHLYHNAMISPLATLNSFWKSSIGKKFVVAITGLGLVLFLAGHLSGNLLIFVGREAFNDYAQFLHHFLHGAGVWVARISLLTMLTLHVMGTIQLTIKNKASRKEYECKTTVQASKSSRIMIISGLTILAFVIFHLLHFTVRVDKDLATMMDPMNPERHDSWGMVIVGFQNIFVVLFYSIAMTLLCSHLSHGVASVFQTLGFRSAKSKSIIGILSKGYAILIWLGFISIPLAIYFFNFGVDQIPTK